MTPDDAFRSLGLGTDATADEVRQARRALAKRHHPDVGGDAAGMRRLNDAAAVALRHLADRATSRAEPTAAGPDTERRGDTVEWDGGHRDVPSFTIEALPAEAFEALLVAAAALGEVEDDDPPYALDVLLGDPLRCWCHLDVVPDAGASTVSISVAPEEAARAPSLAAIRDAWIVELNSLDWSALG